MKRTQFRYLHIWGGGAPKAAPRPYSLSERLHRELTSRKLSLTYDYLHTQPSHLLNLTLCGLLPGPQSPSGDGEPLPSIKSPPYMAAGHHLVYFPPQVTLSQLLPDGTDSLHSPGQPFNRRLWAGGRVRFPTIGGGPFLDGSRAVCIETIRNVVVKGQEGKEKVVVSIERRVGTVEEGESSEDVKRRLWTPNEEDVGESSVIETRDLVFMREKTQEQISHDKEHFEKNHRIVKSPSDPEFRHKIKPTKALLFRFSALTFNAHSIHLDKTYTQDMEGFRNLLIHGPLTLTLLLAVLQAYLPKSNRVIKGIEYKNLAPLYVEEELTVCGKPKISKGPGSWDVWIEGKDGGLAVRGTVQTDSIIDNV
ncbi:hypothetical protein AWENTII_003906 [Aspergillus wentii]|nr:hypothetical protein MW887_006983 [Aspergillus wentii]